MNGHILNNKPSDYLSRIEEENPSVHASMLTHFINAEAYNAAKENNFHRFIDLRGKQIVNRINEVCRVEDSIDTIISLETDELDAFDELDYEETIE